MPRSAVTMGTLTPAGELALDSAPPIRAGRVRVTVEEVVETEAGGEAQDLVAILHAIRADREARGAIRRTREEIDAEINAGRDASEERLQEIEALQERLRAERQGGAC